MFRTDCKRTLRRPVIAPPNLQLTEAEQKLARALTGALARIMLTQAERPEEAPPGTCGLEGLARRKLAGMTGQGREAAIAAARKLASPSGENGGVVDPKLVRQFRRFARERMEKMRPAIQAAIEDVLLQTQSPDFVVTSTTVRLGLSDEGGAFEGGGPHMCLSGAQQIA